MLNVGLAVGHVTLDTLEAVGRFGRFMHVGRRWTTLDIQRWDIRRRTLDVGGLHVERLDIRRRTLDV